MIRTTVSHFPHLHLPSLLATGIALALCTGSVLAQTPAGPASAPASHLFELPAQPLPQGLPQLAAQAGMRIEFAAADVAGLQGSRVVGRQSAAQALDQALAGTGLVWRWRAPGVAVVERAGAAPNVAAPAAEPGVVVTDTLDVAGAGDPRAGGERRDLQGHDDVYDLDITTVYSGRRRVERYKGANPADVVKDLVGVFSGEARNGGALDINIRGIQGPGRAPLTIDGTEQALTVWRGYNGVSNRNYIDPNLIGGIQVVKGPGLVRDVRTGLGGAMVVKTLDVDDILDEGQDFGVDLRAESSSNAVAPRLPTLLTGRDYRDVPEYAAIDGYDPSLPYDDPTLQVQLKPRGNSYNMFSGEDYAYRIAAGARLPHLDVLAAYALRDRGNYFSGARDAGYYQQPFSDSDSDSSQTQDVRSLDEISTLGNRFKPGQEVPNTSSRQESWLLKGVWRPSDAQTLRLTYRDTLSNYGEILPTRIRRRGDGAGGATQWPLSRVDAKAYSLEYEFKPEGSRWLDLYLNLWRTDTVSATYTAGGFPNYANGQSELPEEHLNPILRNTALANAINDRNGLTLSNRFALTDKLDLTVGGDFQHEKLRSRDGYFGTADGWRMYPRAGRREEWQGYASFQWRPTEFLTLNAGMRRVAYWAFDDFLAGLPPEIQQEVGAENHSMWEAQYRVREIHETTYADYAEDIEYFEQNREEEDEFNYPGYSDEMIQELLSMIGTTYEEEVDYSVPWLPDARGRYSRANNPCLNGQVAAIPGLLPWDGVGRLCHLTRSGSVSYFEPPRKRRGHGWSPELSATLRLGDNGRLYARHVRARRYPSMFESTVAFSASVNLRNPLRPERARSYELAYVHDFSPLLPAAHAADFKLAYFVHRTRDVIERNNDFFFTNIDKQTIRGLELHARYDGGRFFTDLGVTRTLENEVCDESTAVLLDPNSGQVPDCVQDGFIGQYLLTQATPRLAINWSLGMRWLDGRLEAGTRLVHYQRHRNPDLDIYKRLLLDEESTVSQWFNIPLSWGRITTVDAYLNYRLNQNLSVELVGTNLGDRYYVDPGARSLMPAPGRTLKLALTARF